MAGTLPERGRATLGTSPLPELSFDELVTVLADRLDTDLAGATPETLLVELGWDSLTVLEASALVDDAGVDLPDELVASWRTLGDVHHAVTARRGDHPTRRRHRDDAVGLAGRRAVLVAAAPTDDEWLHHLHTTGDHLVRYRLRATVPDPGAFQRMLWDRALANFVVWTRDRHRVGFVSAFAPDFRNRHVHVAAVADPAWERSGAVAEGLCVLVSYLFAQFDLRKVYAEVLEPNFAMFASGSARAFRVEGRLVGHEYLSGRYRDTLVLAAHRDEWRSAHPRLVGGEAPF